MKYLCPLLVGAAALGVVHARMVAVPPQPVSPYPDTEVTTNIAFNADNAITREVEIRFALGEGCASNCVQVALGRDLDHDGILDFDETDALFGLRNGRCFVEGVKEGVRMEEPSGMAAVTNEFMVKLGLAKTQGLLSFAATNGIGEAVFTDITGVAPGWLYHSDWDLMRVTRRGPGMPGEWFSCDLRSYFLYIHLR